jgi:hypothetical protein
VKCRICKGKHRLAPNRKICVKCLADRSRRWRYENPERHKQRLRRWKLKNPLKLLEYAVRHNYDFSEKEIQEILKWKSGNCAVCGKFLKRFGQGWDDACIEHDHLTGKFRGISCGRCNRVLGMIEDSKRLLKKLIKYLS